MTKEKDDGQHKVYLNKYSPYSRMSLHSHCSITELAITGVGVKIPFAMSSYCAFEITSQGFTHLSMGRMQYFRSFINKKMDKYVYHQCVFIGQTISDNELIRITVDKIKLSSFDEWNNQRWPQTILRQAHAFVDLI